MIEFKKFRFLPYTFFLSFFLLSIVLAAQPKIDSIKATQNNLKTPLDSMAFFRSLGNEYLNNRNLDSGLVYANLLVNMYENNNKLREANKLKLIICQTYLTYGKYDECFNCLTSVAPLFEDAEDYVAKSMINAYYGGYYVNHIKNWDKGLDYFLRNIQFFRDGKTGDSWSMQYSFQTVAGIYTYKNQYADALKIVEENLVFADKADPALKASTYVSLASLYRNTKNYQKALEASKNALQIYENSRYQQESLADLYSRLGGDYISVKQNDSAYVYYWKAIEVYKAIGNKNFAANLLNYIALQKEEVGDVQTAEKWNEEAFKLVEPGSNWYESMDHRTNVNKMSILIKAKGEKSYTNAEKETLRKYLQKLQPNLQSYLKEDQQLRDQNDIEYYAIFSKAFEKVDSFKQALYFLNKSTVLKDSIFDTEKMKSFSDLESEISMEKERNKLLLEEETKRLELQKQAELKALRVEFEKKQALAKTEDERKRLLLEEELKRREIELKYKQEQGAITLRFEQERQIEKIEQERKDALAQAELTRSRNERNMSILGAGLALLMVGITAWSYLQKRKDNKRIEQEKQKSDELLLNILPFEVAEELKANGKTVAKNYDEVSVLFTDFVGFTANSERIGVQELLTELNICFTEFDNIMGRYGLEKIKTIGDAYLAVSGLPLKDENHANNAIHAAIDILKFIQKRKHENPNTLDIRIGIHSGNVIAGIIGVKKFAYDIWGDTVNTAARMEQASETGRINISDETFQLAQHNFSFEPRGSVRVKGKGEIKMHFVNI
jgi:class 3 adenylate cyclase